MNLQEHLHRERRTYLDVANVELKASQARTIAFIRESVEGMKHKIVAPSYDPVTVHNATLDAVIEILK